MKDFKYIISLLLIATTSIELKIFFLLFSLIFVSCADSVKIKNIKEGKLIPTHYLAQSGEKKIHLDYETAPNPPYMQIIDDVSGSRILSFLNPYKNSIYFYDYEQGIQIGKVVYDRQGPNGIPRIAGYYIKNMDSIYLYNRPIEIAMCDSAGLIKKRISLNDNRKDAEWSRYYPQYEFCTVNPMLEVKGKLIMTGMAPFSIADSLIHKFHFTACIDLESEDIEFIHTYPEELYGSNVNWQDPFFMQGYRAFTSTGEWLYSFPVSHDVYIAQSDTKGYKTKYAGSNYAKTIHSIDDSRERTPDELILIHYLEQDLYTAILHDPYRSVYYRFMLPGIPNSTVKTPIKEKRIVVIIMDEQFNYMGETVIGSCEEWNWKNSFVTSEGLVIEYIDSDLDSEEEYLIMKIFTIEKL